MRVIRHLVHIPPAARPRAVAAGEFDGIHRGHQAILRRLVAVAAERDADAWVIVERQAKGAVALLTLRQQLELLRAHDVASVVFAPQSARVHAIVRVDARVHVVGDGDASPGPGIDVVRVDSVSHDGTRIDASRIAAALERGDLDAARAMLGRDPAVVGRVVHGFHRGGPLGIPTANLRVRGIRLPADGVYAVCATLDGRQWLGAANIGFNPTFGNRIRSVETHLLDFAGDIYGRRLEVAFVHRLRGEQKFSDVTALVAQIRADIAAARRYFADHGR